MRKAILATILIGLGCVFYSMFCMGIAHNGTVNLGLMHDRECTLIFGCWLSMFGAAAAIYQAFRADARKEADDLPY